MSPDPNYEWAMQDPKDPIEGPEWMQVNITDSAGNRTTKPIDQIKVGDIIVVARRSPTRQMYAGNARVYEITEKTVEMHGQQVKHYTLHWH